MLKCSRGEAKASSPLQFTITTVSLIARRFVQGFNTCRLMATESTIGKREQAPWSVPINIASPRTLTLYNSLTRKKEEFVPISGKSVKWYICGPTVYDQSHMGHARAYLSFDILRRVLINYFGYDVNFVMNITDIDDKIIKRARQHHLLSEYLRQEEDDIRLPKVIEDVVNALKHFQKKYDAEVDMDKKQMMDKMMKKVEAASSELENAIKEGIAEDKKQAKAKLVNEARDVLSEWLDSFRGSTVNDHAVFDKLAKQYENEFFSDMARLNVLPPNTLVRVSEYVPEVVSFVKKIIDNKFAYATSDGSVYFDTAAFSADPKHFYAKLVPESYGNVDAELLAKNMREGEGELSLGSDALQLKKSASDFALWKASKAGEPFWVSPWGNGRPGWHIECSAMCTAVCGDKLDIHAGGMDLKFPHHDNEIAQCEAYFGTSSWVNYFLHAGTLRIEGLKMSKSLKNFITIRDALKKYSSRQMRILFLMHNWTDVLDYSTSAMERALQFEKLSKEFLMLIKDILRKHYRPDSSQGYQKLSERELEVQQELFKIQSNFHSALCDSVDTRSAVERLRDIIVLGNAYIVEKERQNAVPNCILVRDLGVYITRQLQMFGVIPTSSEIGFPVESDSADGSMNNLEDTVMPYLTALADFRENVRKEAIIHKVKPILEECDRLRDDVLPELGVRMEDRANQTVIKLCDRETLLMEASQKKAQERAKAEEKEKREREKAEKSAAKEAQRRINYTEMFKQGEHTEKYSQFDNEGIPTHMSNGEEVSKKARKALQKAWETQKKVYEGYLEELKSNGDK